MNKIIMCSGLSIGFCTLSIMSLTLYEHAYKDIYSFTNNVLINKYFIIMGIIGSNMAIICNELLIDNIEL